MEPLVNFHERIAETFEFFADLENGHWEAVCDLETKGLTSKRISDSISMVRMCWELDMPFEQSRGLFRPEVAFDLEHPMNAGCLKKAVVVKSFGPGDVVFSVEFGNKLQCLSSLILKFSDGEQVFRSALRSDFPTRGQDACILMNLSGGAYDSPYGSLVSSLDEGSRTSVKEFFIMPTKNSWMLNEAGIKLLEVWRTDWDKEMTPALCHSLQEKGFWVVALKKCCRGPPLIPKCSGSALSEDSVKLANDVQWEEHDASENFELGTYLHHVSAAFGMGNAAFFDFIDGRNLVFFQAAVQKFQWPAIWNVLEPIMKQHQAAYRRLHGGAGAPYIQVNATPRFIDDGVHCLTGVKEPFMIPDEEPQWDWGALEVKNTFVHFSKPKLQVDTFSAP